MTRINIYEIDNTTPFIEPQNNNIVYIPGFAAGGYAEVGRPTLCNTVQEFTAAFGSTIPTFPANQFYPAGSDDELGFRGRDIPGDGSWFIKGDADPSYLYARELIYAGLPVLYERVNEYHDFGELKEAIEAAGGTWIPANEDDEEGRWADEGFPEEFLGKSDMSYYISVNHLYDKLYNEIFNLGADEDDDMSTEVLLLDKGEYDFKYLTCGGYPSYGYGRNALAKVMAKLCARRGDAVALVDPTDNPERTLTGVNAVYNVANSSDYLLDDSIAVYSALFIPWGEFITKGVYKTELYTAGIGTYIFPGSFAYLKCLAKSIETNPSWLAIAGVSRGVVPNLLALHENNVLTNAIADYYQPDDKVAINPITNIKPYGLTYWGNRTLLNNASKGGTTALSFLNIRNMLCDIKKQCWIAARRLMFEQNTDVLWVNFKALITPLLDQMQTGQGISGYKVIKNPTGDRTKLSATIRIYPIYAVEKFDIYIELSDEEVTVEGE